MNQYSLLISICLCAHLTLVAQIKARGLFCTADDFRRNQLCYSGTEVKIRIHEVIKKNRVSVTTRDSAFTLLKKQLFGYRDPSGHDYRFFQNESYFILNPGEEILLYKRTKGTGLRDSPLTDTYFFSKTTDSEILPLTLYQLRLAFSDNPEIENQIAFYFRSDEELIQFDPLKKQFKLNQLLQQIKK